MAPRFSSRKVVVMVVVVVMLAVLPAVSAIQCYTCHSMEDDYCSDLKANETASKAFLRDCADANIPDNATAFCRKTIQTTLVDGTRRVIRRCGYIKNPKDCYHYDDSDHAEVQCQCFEDACNAARGLQGAASARALVASAAAVLLLLAR
ncbi:uncharacterized protein LOC117654058 [Thrips palmi]|uniref:Uncharacterized protein LOC117654058 n=1 Tax=Thrips palmi TaxID=161013 RepID=A0A6P9AFF6_THRPL|nr:uncharacterized protein LOC117654058 [Thrips palmi]XP_034256090.1 uncharacterized protein LOC117654058 [Thrips palmi]